MVAFPTFPHTVAALFFISRDSYFLQLVVPRSVPLRQCGTDDLQRQQALLSRRHSRLGRGHFGAIHACGGGAWTWMSSSSVRALLTSSCARPAIVQVRLSFSSRGNKTENLVPLAKGLILGPLTVIVYV